MRSWIYQQSLHDTTCFYYMENWLDSFQVLVDSILWLPSSNAKQLWLYLVGMTKWLILLFKKLIMETSTRVQQDDPAHRWWCQWTQVWSLGQFKLPCDWSIPKVQWDSCGWQLLQTHVYWPTTCNVWGYLDIIKFLKGASFTSLFQPDVPTAIFYLTLRTQRYYSSSTFW